jgi:DNA-binding IscR family transcriptional regulator
MNQMIFQSTLSKEAISAYLLCCALTDEGRAITTSALSEVWNSSDAQLQESLSELAAANVIKKVVSDSENHAGYQLIDPHRWQLPK